MGTLLGLVGLAIFVIALCGLIRRRVAWARIHSRRQAGFALALGIALTAAGSAITPAPPQDTRTTVRSDTSAPSPAAVEVATSRPVAGPPPASAAPVPPAPVAPAPPAAAAVPAAPAVVAPAPADVPAAPAVVPAAPAVVPAAVPAAPDAPPASAAVPRAVVPAQRAPASAAAPPAVDTYTNVDGNAIPVPTHAAAAPAGATARCNDGTWSFSRHHSGTCSGHGGVADWL